MAGRDHHGEEAADDDPALAGLGVRVVAALIDAFSVLFLALVVWAVLLAFGVSGSDIGLVVNGVMALVVFVVQVPGVARVGQTGGMAVLGVRVQTGKQQQPGWPRAVVRAAVLYGPALLPVHGLGAAALASWPIVCFAVAAFDPQRRGIHDRVAGTRVRKLPRVAKESP